MPPHAGLTGGAIAGIAVVGALSRCQSDCGCHHIQQALVYKRQKHFYMLRPGDADYTETNPPDAYSESPAVATNRMHHADFSVQIQPSKFCIL